MKRHLIQVHKTKFNKKKTRKIRCDAGKSKEPIAATLSGININKELKDLLPEIHCVPELERSSNHNEKSEENSCLQLDTLKNNELKCESNDNILVISCDILDSTDNVLQNDNNLLKNVEFFSICTNISSENV